MEECPMAAAEQGWYQDPEEWESERYWDGAKWTDEVRPKTAEQVESRSSTSTSLVLAPQAAHPGEVVFAAEPMSTRLGRKSPEQRAQKEAAKQRTAAEREVARQNAAAQRAAQEFATSPVDRARTAFARGDQVFQYSIDVMSQEAIIVIMVGSTTMKRTSDPSDVLNAVSREGWELVNGSFVFVEEGQQSRDKFMSSGQNIAVKGSTVGYYLFKRNPDFRQT